jgi:hypothetical protein
MKATSSSEIAPHADSFSRPAGLLATLILAFVAAALCSTASAQGSDTIVPPKNQTVGKMVTGVRVLDARTEQRI